MSRFYFLLWLSWAFRVTLESLILACGFALLLTLSLYFIQGMPTLSSEVLEALLNLFKFWFPVVWGLTLLIALFRSLKYIFNTPHAGYELQLIACNSDEVLEEIGYGDLVKVWRRWFMLMIWLVGICMILALVITYLFTSFSGIFEWFNIFWMFGFILICGYFSFIFLGARCKKAKLRKC